MTGNRPCTEMHNISAFVNLYVYIRQLLCSVYKSQRWSENTLSKLPLCKLLILNNSCYKQVHAFSTVPKQTKFTSNKQIISYTTYDPDQCAASQCARNCPQIVQMQEVEQRRKNLILSFCSVPRTTRCV